MIHLDREETEIRCWDLRFHSTVHALDPPNTIGETQEYLSISPMHQTSCPNLSFSEKSFDTNIIGYTDQIPLCQIVDKFCVPARCGSHIMRVFKIDLVAISNNHYLKDNVTCVAWMQTGYAISNIAALHILQVKSCD